MAIKTISQFPGGIPADNDYILFEKNGEGKSATLESLPIPASVQSVLDTKVNYSDSLTYTDIINSSDLTNKVASASALKELSGSIGYGYVRLGNGFQICWGNDLSDATITFTVPFTSTPSVSLARYNNDTGVFFYVYTTINSNATSFMIKVSTLSGGGTSARVSWIAVGRWK